MVVRKYTQIKEDPEDFGVSHEEFRSYFGKLVVLLNMHTTGIVYGMMVIILFWTSIPDLDAPDDQLSTMGMALAMAVGFPALFGNISRGMIMKNGFESMVKDPSNFGRVIVHGVVPEVPMIFGLLFAILSLSFSGLLQMEYWMTQDQIDGLLNAAIIFSIMSSGILVSGILLNRMDNPFEERNFARGVLANAAGVIVPIIGLAYYILRFLDMGLFNNGP
jgi:F0F1-type ATP synthase membrane subunit c/vacuolar-type H+-ATPase subunit K